MTRHTRTSGIRPQLDRLEARDCPAVIVAQEGPVLTITGDAADDWVAVCDEGLHVVEVQTERGTEIFRGVRRVVGNLGEGNDTFEFHQAGSTNPSNSLVVKVDLAAGDDRFEYRSPPPDPDQPPPDPDRVASYLFNVRSGLGDDVMIVGPEYLPGLGVEIRAALGDGDDVFEFQQGERPMESLNVAVDLSEGDDSFRYSPPPEPDQPPPEPDRPAVNAFDIRAGAGNDVMTIQPCVVPGLDLSALVDLGDGDDTLDAGFEFPAEAVGTIQPCISLDVEAREGNDAIEVAIGDPDIADPPRVEDVHVGVRGFGGDDSGIIIICNVAVTGRLTEVMDLGAGDDTASLTLDDVAVGGLLKQSVTGGDGSDEVGIIIIGGRVGAVAQKVHTGGGDDLVSMTWKKCEILGPVVTQVVLAEDHDVADVTISESKYFGPMTATLDAGGGDDSIAVMLSNPNEFLGSVRFRMALGEGDDEGTYFGEGHAHVAGLMAMTMNTGGGDDWASVMIQDSEDFQAFGGPVVLRVALGEGDDLANVVVRDAYDVAGPLTVAVAGGVGDDGIIADVDFTPRVRAGQLDPGNAPASVLVALRGGDGLDTIDAYTEGVWNGVARFLVRGGAGEDDLGFHAVIGEGSTGALAVALDGGAGADVLATDLLIPVEQIMPINLRLLAGAGDDVLSLSLLGGTDTTPEPHLFVLDGGDGFDLARAPAGAVVRNCEGRA